ncbi:short-chain dehydrogenase reductase 3b-like [Sesamum indicum]|uniref:Short-chain dehydrogenase reductase 3b-like n=1 Tax=Sesamum indicum TaxID=4182 RepID=A0A6I9U6A0_SESIN|nr:short-chain dehydrogenase reductase 3b-like [Sesamum indicum]
MSTGRLEGKVAIITGAASGIGEATARLFVHHGAFIVIADIQDELGAQVAASIGEHRATYKHCDVRDEKQVEETVAFTVAKYGKLDIMYSNAGILGPIESILDMDISDGFDKTVAVNARGAAIAIKHAARVMVAGKVQGSIICTASTEATRAGRAPAAYVASKHAVLGLVRAAARELGPHGIRVNCVSPHGVATPMVCDVLGMDVASVEARFSGMGNLKGVVLKKDHVAEAVLFLASDESAYVSATNLSIDGGLSTMI